VKRRKHTPEQIVRKLREADQLLSEGKRIPEVAMTLGAAEQTFHRWRNTYGGMKAEDVKRLKALERENGQLKLIVADKELESLALKEIAEPDGIVRQWTVVPGSIYGSGAGTQQNNGQAIVVIGAGGILTVRNHSSSAAVGLPTPIGRTQATASASIAIEKLT